jgi:hypothetical protein
MIEQVGLGGHLTSQLAEYQPDRDRAPLSRELR